METLSKVVLEGDEWRHAESALSRALWCAVLAAPLCLALAGLFVLAALSRGRAADKAGLVQLEYNRLDRFAAPTTLRVLLAGQAVGGRELKLFVNQGYINGVRIRRIEPPPIRVERAHEGLVFVFASPGRGRPASVLFQVEGVAYGSLDGLLAVGDGPRLGFRQYLLP